MRRRRTVDELSLEELERLVLLKRREERQRRLHRVLGESPETPPPPFPAPPDVPRHDDLAFLKRVRRRHQAAWSRGLSQNASWYDRLLLFVEVLALAGLLITLIFFLLDREALNTERLAALVTTADVTPVPEPETETPRVLPGRPPPPVEGQPVYPALYTEWIQPAAAPASVPVFDEEESRRLPARIQIPKINVDAPIVPGDDWEALKRGVGWHLGSARPGERGNMVLSAHNDIFGEIFRYLHELEPGDDVFVYDQAGRRYHYVVAVKRIVEPTAVEVLRQTNEPVATLITCYPYLIDTQRLVVVAELQP